MTSGALLALAAACSRAGQVTPELQSSYRQAAFDVCGAVVEGGSSVIDEVLARNPGIKVDGPTGVENLGPLRERLERLLRDEKDKGMNLADGLPRGMLTLGGNSGLTCSLLGMPNVLEARETLAETHRQLAALGATATNKPTSVPGGKLQILKGAAAPRRGANASVKAEPFLEEFHTPFAWCQPVRSWQDTKLTQVWETPSRNALRGPLSRPATGVRPAAP
jgi:hypothetical protein